MTGLLVGLVAVLVVALINNVWASLAGKYEFRVETDVELAAVDQLIRASMSGATPFQKTEGTLEHGYQRVLKRGIGPYRSSCQIMVDVLPVVGSDIVVVTGWVEEYFYGRQLLLFADPLGPAPIWGSFKLRKVLKLIEAEAQERRAQIEVTVDHDGNLMNGGLEAPSPAIGETGPDSSAKL